MHVETLQLVKKMTDFEQDTASHGVMVDCSPPSDCSDVTSTSQHAVTSECGVQAASDTVCRGSQITPATRDAGCQYEETPILQQRNTFPSIIKPSPIKHLSPPMKKEKHSPNTSPTDPNSQNIFLGAKGLHSLNKNSSADTLVQAHLKQLQSQVLQDSLNRMKTDPLDQLNMRSMAPEEPSNISSLLQPALMNSLPLTSYALLLDMLNRQAAAGTNASQLASHINQIQQLSKPTPTSTPSSLSAFPMNLNMNSSLVKPTPLTSQSLNTVLSQAGSPLLKPSLSNSSLLNSTSVSSLLSNSGGLLGRSTSPASLLSSPASLLSSTLSSHPTMLTKPGTSPPNNKRFLIHPPVMMHRESDHAGKRDMDIESLVDSVIDEHMSSNNSNVPTNYNLNYSTQNCVFNREIMNDYDMAPPFKRRRRTVFTERQLQGLEEAYTKSQYLDRESRLELCKKLGLSLHTVVYWFQNKRAISRRRGQPLEGNNNHSFNNEEYTSFKLNQSPPTSPLTSVSMSTYSPPTMKASMVTSMVSPPSSRQGSMVTTSPTTMTGMSATLTTSSMTKTAINTVGPMVGATN